MKLLSLNIGLFEANNAKLEQFLKEQQPDVLCLQEATKKVDESALQDFVSFDTVNEATPRLTSSFFAPIWVLSKFEKKDFHGEENFVFDLGGKVEFGQYLRSRLPILKGQNVFVQNHFSYVTDWSSWPQEDYRAVQVVDLSINGKVVRVLNYHGIWSRDKRGTDKTLAACERIRELAQEADECIICGDFNLFPDTDSIKVLSEAFTSLIDIYDIRRTRPSSNELSSQSRNVVDYIFVSKGIMVNSFEVIQSDVSDHLPLVLDFDL